MRYTYSLQFSQGAPDGEWLIMDTNVKNWQWEWVTSSSPRSVVARFLYKEGHDGEDQGIPPIEVRREYERLNGVEEFLPAGERHPPSVNVVEMVADPSESAFDQPCIYGYRVEQHAVYCHNDWWLYAPRKCHRERLEFLHEKCSGFEPNPTWHGLPSPL